MIGGLIMIRMLSIFAFLAVAAAANADTLTLSSHYSAAGTNPDGSKYTGTVAVQIISDSTFAIQWTIGGALYKGSDAQERCARATYRSTANPD